MSSNIRSPECHKTNNRRYWPCLAPSIFNPYNLDPDQWMEASAALGMKEICASYPLPMLVNLNCRSEANAIDSKMVTVVFTDNHHCSTNTLHSRHMLPCEGITAKHEGGFALWPSNHTPYSVRAATNFRGGKGDVLRDFVAAAKRWGIKVKLCTRSKE